MLGLIDPTHRSTSYFGGPSVRNFLQQIQAMVDTKAQASKANISPDPLFANKYLYGTSIAPRGPPTAPELPSQDLADELIELYVNHWVGVNLYDVAGYVLGSRTKFKSSRTLMVLHGSCHPVWQSACQASRAGFLFC